MYPVCLMRVVARLSQMDAIHKQMWNVSSGKYSWLHTSAYDSMNVYSGIFLHESKCVLRVRNKYTYIIL